MKSLEVRNIAAQRPRNLGVGLLDLEHGGFLCTRIASTVEGGPQGSVCLFLRFDAKRGGSEEGAGPDVGVP